MMRSLAVSMSAGWLVPRMIQILSSAAPAFICTELCRTLSVGPLSPRVASVSSLMYSPNRNGEGEVSLRCCFDESSNGREQSAWIALSFTLPKKAERSTNDSDSLQAMRCDSPPIRFYRVCVLPVRACRSISNRLHPVPDDPVDQLRIRQARLACRKREVLVLRQNGIRVCLDKINLVVRGEPQIDARVTVDGEQAVNAFARILDTRDQRRVEPFGELVL